MEMRFSEELVKRYLRAGYRLVGRHSAVEICRWTKSALRGEHLCYKRWYGVKSHRCIQMTPNLNFCNFSCIFCWRIHTEGRFKLPKNWKWDDPKLIVDGIIKAQRELLIGFKGNPKVSKERFLEAMFPRHVAVSLDGEPTLYPMIAELINEIKKRNMTAYLVTNGSIPLRIKELITKDAQPTNLYISVYGPNRKIFEATAKPNIPNAWELVKESLSLMPKFKSRTIMRLTMVKDVNMTDPEGYAKIAEIGYPHFIELKGYTWVGESQKRLPITAMPTLQELKKFAEKISEATGYKIKLNDEKSRVVMLVRDEDVWDWNLKLIEEWNKKVEKLEESWKDKIKDFRQKDFDILYY